MVSDTNDFLIDHFDTAMRIHAIAGDSGLDDDHARLLVYIHVKALASPSGVESFEGDCSAETDAIRSMLGQTLASDGSLTSVSSTANSALRKAEFDIQERCGMESALQPELRRRLMFHTDAAFRRRMLGIYAMVILPQLGRYDREKVEESIARQKRTAD